jgi:hypothetical protein
VAVEEVAAMEGLRTQRVAVVSLGQWLVIGLLGVGLIAASPGRAAEEAAVEAWESQVTAGSGDSWTSIRGRMCPLESLQAANPELAKRPLRPGDVIRSPVARTNEAALQRANAMYKQLESRLTEELERRTQLEARVGVAETLERDLATSKQAAANASRNSTMMVIAIAVALALFAIALVFAISARQDAERVSRRFADAEERYTDLRRSLQSLEVSLQKRVLDLLSMHRGNVSEEQIGAATLSVIEMAERLKRRHAG